MQRVVSAQAECAVNALGGVARTVLKRTDHNAKYVILQVRAEIDAGTTLAKHTHPGVESVYILQGGFEEFAIQGQPSIALEAGDGFTVAADTPHGGKTGPQPTKILVTYVVEKDKPLASPA
jgi:quercetin dioxygenase-like cupin family protein